MEPRCTWGILAIYLSEVFPNVLEVYPRCTRGLPKMYPKCTQDVPEVQPHTSGTWCVLHVCLRCNQDVPEVHPRCTWDVPQPHIRGMSMRCCRPPAAFDWLPGLLEIGIRELWIHPPPPALPHCTLSCNTCPHNTFPPSHLRGTPLPPSCPVHQTLYPIHSSTPLTHTTLSYLIFYHHFQFLPEWELRR